MASCTNAQTLLSTGSSTRMPQASSRLIQRGIDMQSLHRSKKPNSFAIKNVSLNWKQTRGRRVTHGIRGSSNFSKRPMPQSPRHYSDTRSVGRISPFIWRPIRLLALRNSPFDTANFMSLGGSRVSQIKASINVVTIQHDTIWRFFT